MAISQKIDSKKSPISPSKSKINKKIWEAKKNLVKKRLMGLVNEKKNILMLEGPLKVDKPIKSILHKVKKTSDMPRGISVSTSAVERAQDVQANLLPQYPSFSKLMLKSHVSGGFWLGLPRSFCVAHLPKHDETIVLVDEDEQECETKYLAAKNGLSGGWRGFSLKHRLCDGDVLVFQLIEPHKFKLYIVRAGLLTEVDGAMGLLNLDFKADPIDQAVTTLTGDMKMFEVSSYGGNTLSLALFVDVTNSKELLDLMQAGTLEPEVAFLNASLIPDVFPVLAAAYKSSISKSRDSLTTRTLHSELVYNYSASKHISESLKRCGISDSTSYILVARFGASADEMIAVKGLIKGTEIGLEELVTRADRAQIQKHYKISTSELGISSISDAIICRIAARDAL